MKVSQMKLCQSSESFLLRGTQYSVSTNTLSQSLIGSQYHMIRYQVSGAEALTTFYK